MPSLPTPCRIWTHQKSRKYGYGLVHRIIYEYVYGAIPEGYAEYTRNWIDRHPKKREARLAYMKEYHQKEKEI